MGLGVWMDGPSLTLSILLPEDAWLALACGWVQAGFGLGESRKI